MNKEEARDILSKYHSQFRGLSFEQILKKKEREILHETGASGQEYIIEINIGPVSEVNTDDYQIDLYAYEKGGRLFFPPNVCSGFVINQ